MANTGFQLKSMTDINKGMFAPTDPAAKQKAFSVFLLPLDCLRPLKNHHFKLYTGKQFDDMVNSIRENGVILPIIVRPIDENTYEILSGHNRGEASKAAGLLTIQAIVRENLTEDEARLIAIITNLLQRSFAEMCHSERAFALTEYYGAIKNQGRRTDLIDEIERMTDTCIFTHPKTSAPMEQKLNSREKLAQKYGMDSSTIARYLRVEKLIEQLKARLDNGAIALRAAVTLSYLSVGEQQAVNYIMESSPYKLDIKKADALRTASEKQTLDNEKVKRILAGDENVGSMRQTGFKLKPKIISKYFPQELKAADIEAAIIEALDFYYAHKGDKEL